MDKNTLLTLLIHFRTKEDYYADLESVKKREIERIEKQHGQPFDSLPESFQAMMNKGWFWPPWRFNDIVGFAVIRLENEWTMVADLYLPKNRVTRRSKAKDYLFNYVVTDIHIEKFDLIHLQKAIYRIIAQLKEQLAEKRWHLEYDQALIDNLNFVGMIAAR